MQTKKKKNRKSFIGKSIPENTKTDPARAHFGERSASRRRRSPSPSKVLSTEGNVSGLVGVLVFGRPKVRK